MKDEYRCLTKFYNELTEELTELTEELTDAFDGVGFRI